MKQSMQVVAMVAFLGCFAILVIAAGSRKAKTQENCGEELNKIMQPGKRKPSILRQPYLHRMQRCVRRTGNRRSFYQSA
ncbi:hypothetical protein [Paraflavitalea speifideaquila]|uniref:hypothetical protein n=1 Tax=Paraflavitalea speifideaquila TaxID=3076558 RepID=UPI0028E5341A|nr:hypothetical protein [Paraflavitalea speifideiaquila]